MINSIIGVLVAIAVLVALAVHQNKEDMKEMANAPALEVGECYAFSDHISLGKGKFPLFKILEASGGIEYVETSWLPLSRWRGDKSISERNSMFYSKVRCPDVGEVF